MWAFACVVALFALCYDVLCVGGGRCVGLYHRILEITSAEIGPKTECNVKSEDIVCATRVSFKIKLCSLDSNLLSNKSSINSNTFLDLMPYNYDNSFYHHLHCSL